MKPKSFISAVEDVLLQGCGFLHALPPGAYSRPLQETAGASIGAHYRHVLDHFFCLLEGVRTGNVNYDQRQRNPELERSVTSALFATTALIDDFRKLPVDVLQHECTVVYSVAYGDDAATSVRSNVARELMFCVGHAIHHYAILKLLCAAVSAPLPYEFGVAPSTLKHLEAQAAH